MLSRKRPRQQTCFIPGSLADYIPADHILRKVDAVLDLRWLEGEVKELYDPANGRPCIAPERALRLMLAGFFHGMVQDRKLIREAQVNIAYRWFAGYELGEPLPDHSSLTRIRRRWGEATFRRIFARSVAQCAQAGLVEGETLHVDATLIRADCSWESLVQQHVGKVLSENAAPLEQGEPAAANAPPKPGGKTKRVSVTDPEASLTTSCRKQRLEPCYKQHTAVDDKAGIIVAGQVTIGEAHEGQELLAQIQRVAELCEGPAVVTADRGYASSENYALLEAWGMTALIPPQPEGAPHRGMPLARFAYDERNDLVRPPAGKQLVHRPTKKAPWVYRAQASDCRACPLRARCVPPSGRVRTVQMEPGYPALLRARRAKLRGWLKWLRGAYRRHRFLVEGLHGEAKTQHGLRRAVRRGRANVSIQAYLTAAVMNLKRLACHNSSLIVGFLRLISGFIPDWLRRIARIGENLTSLAPAA